jgi:glycosyltransferase involved in cell wall biosynthesis
MKLLVWSPIINPGGGERLLSHLITAMRKNSKVAQVTFLGPNNKAFRELLESKNVDFVPMPSLERVVRLSRKVHFPGRWQNYLKSILSVEETRKLQPLLSYLSDKHDITYVFWPHRNPFPVGLLNRAVCCTIQDMTFFDFPEILGWKQTQQEKKNLASWLKNSKQVVVSSHNTQCRISYHYSEWNGDVKVIRHDILPDTLDIADTETESIRYLNLPEHYVVFPANIMVHKNHYNLFLAWARFKRSLKIPLVLLGDGTKSIMENDSINMGVWQARLAGVLLRCGFYPNKDYFCLGYVPDEFVLPIIKKSKALIMPALSEGGGSYPIEEALSLGVPVLCSDIPVFREQLLERSAKISWFDPESPTSIEQALLNLFENYDKYKQSALDGVNDIRPTWDDIAEEYIKCFLSMIGNPGVTQ